MNFVQMVPSDIPLFPGYKWTLPQDAAIWSGEQWFDGAYNNVGAKIIISNRLQSAGSAEVQAWYEQKMNGNGWVKEQDSAQSEGNFKAVYAKGNRMATIIFYGGETPDRPSPFVGYRLMILYK